MRPNQRLDATFASWNEKGGDVETLVALNGRVSDLIIVDNPAKAGPFEAAAFDAAVFSSGRPALMLGERLPDNLLRHVVIAWKPERPCARALAAALPLLAAADQVTLLHVDSPFDDVLHAAARDDVERAGLRLRRDGVAATTRLIQSSDDAGDILLEEIRRIGADLVVMGAWGRPRWSERAFGGCTRTLLSGLEVACFATH